MQNRTDFCPHCRTQRNLTCSQSVSEEEDPNGRKIRIRTFSFHCSVCHTFVISEGHPEKRIGF